MLFLIKLKIILQSNWFYFALLLFTIFFVILNSVFNEPKSKLKMQDEYVGVITNIKYTNEKWQLTIKVDNEKIIAYYNNKNESFKLGQRIKIKGKVNIPKKNTIPNTFNYQKYLNNHHIFYTFSIDEYEIINSDGSLIYKVKNYLIKRMDKSLNSNYLKAFIIGDKSDLEDYQTYAINGVSHLFALSGMHISLLSGIIMFFLKKWRRADLFIIVFLIFYTFITNYSASLIRSVLLFILSKINKKGNFDLATSKVLFLTMFLMIMADYLIIYDLGFVYSCIVSLGLIYSKKYYKKNYFYNLFVTSVIAFLFSLPITLYNSYEINLISIVSNLLIVPIVSLVVYPLTLIILLLPFFDPILSLFVNILEFINNILKCIPLNIVIPKVSMFFYLIYYFLLFSFINNNKIVYIIFALMFIFSFKLKPLFTSDKKIIFLDVGQGDSMLIINKNNGVLIDTGVGNTYDISDNTIKYLKSMGISKLSSMVLTHGDSDHMGEAINFVNNFKVEKVIFNCGNINELEQNIIKVLNKRKIAYYSCIKELNIRDNKLYFLNNQNYDNENDNSIVIYTNYNNYKFLFMGDASIKVENDLMEQYNLNDIDVLKVGHHGSKTSSSKEFIDKINPKYSVISVGKNNRYGHPNKDVLSVLKKSNIYRTDMQGSIMFKIKNNKLKIETCSP